MESRSQFACIPLFWLRHLPRRSDLLTAIALLSFTDKSGHAQAGERALAQRVGLSKTAVHACLVRLAGIKLIVPLGAGKMGQNYYVCINEAVTYSGPLAVTFGAVAVTSMVTSSGHPWSDRNRVRIKTERETTVNKPNDDGDPSPYAHGLPTPATTRLKRAQPLLTDDERQRGLDQIERLRRAAFKKTGTE